MHNTKIFDSYIILENDIALLKPLSYEDVSGLAKVAFEGDDKFKNYPDIMETSNDLILYISMALKKKLSETAYPFVITDKRTGKVAGTTRYANMSYRDKRLEIGWTWLGKDYRGTGLNKACKYELLRFAFEEMEFRRVEFKTDLLNTQSRKALAKIGATEEGTLRKHTWMEARKAWRDTVYFSIISDEWNEVKERVFTGFIK
jgi:RimJ/RimL family protein N-acetyltransferase